MHVIHVEDYLTSVISSEMSATASLELLKASCCDFKKLVISGAFPTLFQR